MSRGQETDPFEEEKIKTLLIRFCIPALASNLVTSVYNIVDQIFIGNVLGIAGNAATNVIFPVITLVTALSLMCGVGSSNAMNMARGNGDIETAKRCVSGGVGLMVFCGTAVMVPMLLWTEDILDLFGCTPTVMPYALPYARIIALSFVFSVIGAAGPFLIRADGAPNFSLTCIATGSILNVILDALFILGFGWGIRGAAWATLLAQMVSAGLVVWYLTKKFRSFGPPLLRPPSADAEPCAGQCEGSGKKRRVGAAVRLCGRIAAIGFGPAFNFATQAMVQVFLNNGLRAYGSRSVYGSDVCLAVAGVAGKVNTLASAIVVGLTNGMQPILSYNFGRKNYARVAETAKKVVGLVLGLSLGVFLCYQLFPVQITSFFGDGNTLYFSFAGRFFRIFYLGAALVGLQSSVAGFFSAQGKVGRSILISLVRQVIIFPPLLILLPKILGLDGILWAGPAADLAMATAAGALFVREIRRLEAS